MTNSENKGPDLRKRLLLGVALAASAVLILAYLYLNLMVSRTAQNETLQLGAQLSQQTAILARPLLLAEDRISLNFLLNELNQLNYVQGIQVIDQEGIPVARAGNTSPLKQHQLITQQDNTIGSITIWLNAAALKTTLNRPLIPALVLAIAGILASLGCILFLCRPTANKLTAKTEQADKSFDQTLNEQFSTPAFELPTEKAAEVSAPVIGPTTVTESPQSAETTLASEVTHANEQTFEPEPESTPDTSLQTQALVDLLKPEQNNTPQMPRFEHQPDFAASTEAEPQQETVIFEETPQRPGSSESSNKLQENPLFRAEQERDEVQLDLYSFEHELELILPAMEASYLIYLDSCTANSENADESERTQLLSVYHHFAEQVARIYKGQCDRLENGDITICFDMRDEKDNHGTNALCAAILFNLLYKGFNHSRIRSFRPVLSLQMALARGNHNRINLIQEEAHFLTRTTQSNELISHTALTEAPLLKQAILQNAEIRREDEDKVLILKVTDNHQQLLKKQANHLLNKIFEKN